jgi:hypothetical protein
MFVGKVDGCVKLVPASGATMSMPVDAKVSGLARKRCVSQALHEAARAVGSEASRLDSVRFLT